MYVIDKEGSVNRRTVDGDYIHLGYTSYSLREKAFEASDTNYFFVGSYKTCREALEGLRWHYNNVILDLGEESSSSQVQAQEDQPHQEEQPRSA